MRKLSNKKGQQETGSLFKPQNRNRGMKWWLEIALVFFFYLIYSFARNQFGSANVSPEKALKNAEKIAKLIKLMRQNNSYIIKMMSKKGLNIDQGIETLGTKRRD